MHRGRKLGYYKIFAVFGKGSCIMTVIVLLAMSPAYNMSQEIVSSKMEFTHLSAADGLETNRVYMTLEDHQGFLWVATDRGISRYNGLEFEHFQLPGVFDSGQANFVLTHLSVDKRDNVWAISSNGYFFRFDMAEKRFLLQHQPDPERIHYFRCVYYDSGSNRFLLGAYNGLFVYGLDSMNLKKSEVQLPSVTAIIPGQSANLYLGTAQGIYSMDIHLDSAYPLLTSNSMPEAQFDFSVLSLYLQENEGKLWVGFASQGLWSYSVKDSTFLRASGVPSLPIKCITAHKGGRLLLGMDGGGLSEYDAYNNEVLSTMRYDDQDEHSLSSNAIYHINITSVGVVFISTYRGGLNVHNPQRELFYRLSHVRGNPNSLEHNSVLSIEELPDGRMSFGTDKGLSIWDRQENKWTQVDIKPFEDQFNSSVILSQFADEHGQLWVSSYLYGLNMFYLNKSGELKHREHSVSSARNISNIYVHSSGKILLSSDVPGLSVLEDTLVSFLYSNGMDIDGFSNDKVVVCLRDGPAIFDIGNYSFNWISDLSYARSIKDQFVIAATVDAERNIWLGSKNHGVSMINMAESSIKQYTTEDGLLSDQVINVVCDKYGSVWVASEEGLSRIQNGLIENFRKSGQIFPADFNANSACSARDGTLYFGAKDGVWYFDPQSLIKQKPKKRIYFSDLILSNTRVVPDQYDFMTDYLDNLDEIRLPYDHRSFSIEFSVLDLSMTSNGIYQWRLHGMESQWNFRNADQTGRIDYNNIGPGDYVFELQLVDFSDKVIAPPRTIRLIIEQPVWKSWWAFVLYLLLIVLLVFMLLYVNRSRIQSQHAEERLHFLVDMAHEIKTPLTLISAPLKDISNVSSLDESIRERIEVALKSAEKLQTQMVTFLDFRKHNLQKGNLKNAPLDLIDLINSKIFAFSVFANRKEIILKFDTKRSHYFIKSDEQVLDKILDNMLSNAIKYTPQGGEVILTLSENKKYWELSVRDSGLGIAKEDQKKIFTLFYRTNSARDSSVSGSGVGLVLASDLAKAMGGEIELRKSDSSGSDFILKIPKSEPPSSVELAEFMDKTEKEVPDELLTGDERFVILMVEDDPTLLDYQKTKFKDKYRVLVASDGVEALEVIKNTLPDLIISDVIMPKMNGRQLCMNVKNDINTSHIPFILLTGLESKENIERGFESGADDYLVKPIDFEILSLKIENLIKTRNSFKGRFLSAPNQYEFDYQEITNQLDKEFLEKITSMAMEHISDPDFSVHTMCNHVGMSRTAFYHKFKSLAGITPSEFVRTLRMKKAHDLLLDPLKNISEVAYSVGFSDAKYFSALFKKFYGQLPSEYVAAQRGKQ